MDNKATCGDDEVIVAVYSIFMVYNFIVVYLLQVKIFYSKNLTLYGKMAGNSTNY